MAAALAKFVNASRKGWDCAVKNQAEAVNIVLKDDASSAQTEHHQARMTGEVAKRVAGGSLGRLDPEAVDRTEATLMTGRCDPIITNKPLGATPDAIWTAAKK